jgi:hypothetical protein
MRAKRESARGDLRKAPRERVFRIAPGALEGVRGQIAARQVGSGCLREFLGGVDPEHACRHAERLALARDRLARAERTTSSAVPLAEFAAHAAHVVRARGWVSRARAGSAGGPASADQALRSLRATPDAPGAADRALADGALRGRGCCSRQSPIRRSSSSRPPRSRPPRARSGAGSKDLCAR